MDQNWKLKKTLEHQISDTEIDKLYDTGMKSGAIGGKLIGAGGGGFMLFVAPPKAHQKIRESMKKYGLTEQNFSIDYYGSRVIFVGDQKA